MITGLIAFSLFEIGRCHAGDFFELAGKMRDAAIVHYKGYIGQGKFTVSK